MKIASILPVSTSNNLLTISNTRHIQNNKPIEGKIKNFENKSPTYANIIAFYGQKISSPSFKSNYETKPQFSYLEFIKEKNGKPEVVQYFLNSVLKEPKTRNVFIEEVTKEPEKSQEIVRFLQQQLGGPRKFLNWYLGENGYVHNYEKYLKEKYEKATSIKELLKIQPNWGYWALEQKTLSSKGYRNHEDFCLKKIDTNFNFGELPQNIEDKATFNELIEEIKDLPFFAKNKLIEIEDKEFIVSQLSGGDMSYKNIYKVTDEDGDAFIVKLDRFPIEDALKNHINPYYPRTAKESKLLRGDSVYLDACIDYYLQLNGSKSHAQLLYYDFNKNAAIYEYIDCKEINETQLGILEQLEANRLLPDINKLGVYLTDIGTTFNCYKDTQDNYRVIDVGHAEYIDLLKPGARLLTIETSNLCGFSIKNIMAGLNLATINNFEQEKKHPYLDDTAMDYNVDYSLFMENKKAIKENLKQTLQENIEKYGENSEEAQKTRYNLVEFYKSNILARKAGYGSTAPYKINGLLNAMRRYVYELEKFDSENKYKEYCKFLNDFIEESYID